MRIGDIRSVERGRRNAEAIQKGRGKGRRVKKEGG